MTHSPFEQMQRSVDIVQSSPHPVNKIAATLYGQDLDGLDFSISKTNYWPDSIQNTIGTDQKVGNSSGTIHAETACILEASYTRGAILCITDPFCPNCAKNISEAGIKKIYIDHKGFEKDFASRRGDHFANMSMQICAKAGISVYKLNRKAQEIETIFESDEDFEPYEDSPVFIKPVHQVSDLMFKDWVSQAAHIHHGRKYAAAFAMDERGQFYAMHVRSHPAVGYSMDQDSEEIQNEESKYSFILQPLGRLLMNAARNGHKILDGYLYSSVVPTSRELVNLTGTDIQTIYIGNMDKARDAFAFSAKATLSDNAILTFKHFGK